MSDCTISSLDMDDVSSPVKFIPASSCEASSDSADRPEALSLMESSSKQSMSREWTDEKHSMYLKSMEASFVNQLYTSLDLLGCHSQKKHSSDSKPSRQMHAGVRVPSGQFKVLRGGNWGNVNFERNGPQLGKADESCALLSNQWIRRFRFGCVNQDESSPTHLSKAPLENHAAYLKEKSTITSALAADTKQSNLCNSHLDSVGSRTEASGQNFIDEDIEGDKASGAQTAKRKNVASLSYDQVVPFSSFAMTENVNKAH